MTDTTTPTDRYRYAFPDAFAGLTANTPWYDTTLGLAMLIGRFLMIGPIMALAGSLATKQAVPTGPGTFPVNAPPSPSCSSSSTSSWEGGLF